jgi:hypothetical protein
VCSLPYKDTDTMSVVYYGNSYTYLEVGRVEYLREHGLSMSEVNRRLHLPVVESFVRGGHAVTAPGELREAGTPGRAARGHHPGERAQAGELLLHTQRMIATPDWHKEVLPDADLDPAPRRPRR